MIKKNKMPIQDLSSTSRRLSLPPGLDKKSKDLCDSLMNHINRELANIKTVFQNQLDESINTLKNTFETSLLQFTEEITSLRMKVDELKEENAELKTQMDCLEQRQYSNTLVISGESLVQLEKKCPPNTDDYEKPMLIIHKILSDSGLKPENYSIISAYRLGKRNMTKNGAKKNNRNGAGNEDNRPIIIEVDDGLSKKIICNAIIKTKSTVYVNEFLTKRRQQILKDILSLRKTNKSLLSKVNTRNGVIYIKSDAFKHPIKIYDQNTFEEFVSRLVSHPDYVTE